MLNDQNTPGSVTGDTTHNDTIERVKMALQLRVLQQQPSKAVLGALETCNSPLNPDLQALVISAIMNPINQLLPPNTAYLKRLIRLLIQQVEEQKEELSEELLNIHMALLMSSISSSSSTASSQEQQDSSWRYKTFYYSSNPSWQQLQQLQQQHVQHCIHITQQQQQVSAMPAAQLLQLQILQQQMRLLAAAAAQQQQSLDGTHPTTSSSLTAAVHATRHHHQQQQQQQRSHEAGLLSVHMSENLFEGGTGCHMWDAGFLMAEFVLNNLQLFAGKRCIEIGCGPGLVASCLCRVGAKQLLLTDGDPQTLVNCISNLNLNGHGHAELVGSWREAVRLQETEQQPSDLRQQQQQEVLACPLDWHEDVPGLCADIIIGSDICYDPEAVPSLVRLLQQLLGARQAAGTAPHAEANRCSCESMRRNCIAYIATTKRQDSTLARFERLASEHGLSVQEVAMQPSAWEQQAPVMFQQLLALQECDSRFVLHRVCRSLVTCI